MARRLLFREALLCRQSERAFRKYLALFSDEKLFSQSVFHQVEPSRSSYQEVGCFGSSRPVSRGRGGQDKVDAVVCNRQFALVPGNLEFQSRFISKSEYDFSKNRKNWEGFEAVLQNHFFAEKDDQFNQNMKLDINGHRRIWDPKIDHALNSLISPPRKTRSSRGGSARGLDVGSEDKPAKCRKIQQILRSEGFSTPLSTRGVYFKTYGTSRPQFVRYMTSGSTIADGMHQEADSIQNELLGITDSITDVVAAASSSSASVVSEVAAASADSSFPIAALQYLIEAVHLQTGLPWWGSIALATILVRITTFPIVVYQMRATARLSLLRPEMEEISKAIQDSGYDPKVSEENQRRLKELFQKHNTSPFTPLIGGFVQAPIFMCFFFAISNMAEKMPSLKEGGTLWFTDLSTPDDMYILPVMTALLFWLTVELGVADGMQGQPNLEKLKAFLRILAVLMVPLTMNFPKALFCYWMTSNLFSFLQSTILKQAKVKEIFGIPDVSHLATAPKSRPDCVATYRNPPKRGKRFQGEGKPESEK